MNKNEYCWLQKTAKLSNREAAEYLGVGLRVITKWRNNESKAPKAVMLALEYYIKSQLTDQLNEQEQDK